MEDAARLENIIWWLNRSKSFKDWAMKSIRTNLHAFTHIQRGKCIQNKLSPELRDELLQELQRSTRREEIKTEEEFISMTHTALVLMSTATKKLDLHHLMSFERCNVDSPLEFIEVLRVVTISAPNVRQLIVAFDDLADCLNNAGFIRNTFIDHLSALKELRILKVVGCDGTSVDIALLYEKLPNLLVVSAPYVQFEDAKLSELDIGNSAIWLFMQPS